MRIRILGIKTVAILIFVFLMMSGQAFCEGIEWKSYGEGMALSRQENKKVFLHFRTDWCGYCRKMDQTTFQDVKVIEFLNKHFVSITVDGDKEKSHVKEYKVGGYPDNRFLDEKGKDVYKLPGLLGPMAFLFYIEYIQSDSYRTMTPEKYYESKL
jgi:thioredoxin-related protein